MSLTRFQCDQIRLLLDAHESRKDVQRRELPGGKDWCQSINSTMAQIKNVLYGNYEYRIKPELKKVWVNVYPDWGPKVHDNEEEASGFLLTGGKTICVEFDND